jgi:hypothetical protein
VSDAKDANSLRAFAIDTSREDALPVIEQDDSDPAIARPVRRIPIFAKLTFALVIGSCVVVLALCGRAIYADRSLRHPHAALASPPPPPIVVESLPPPAAPPPVVASAEEPAPPPSEAKPAKKAPTRAVDKKKGSRKPR